MIWASQRSLHKGLRDRNNHHWSEWGEGDQTHGSGVCNFPVVVPVQQKSLAGCCECSNGGWGACHSPFSLQLQEGWAGD